jgi:integrase
MHYETVRRHFAEARDKAGVEDARIHDIRAKSLTDADRQGEDAQRLAGHSSAGMTERYLRLRRTEKVRGPVAMRAKP